MGAEYQEKISRSFATTTAGRSFALGTDRTLRFDEFEIDFDNRELRRQGIRINLQEKPFRILELLVENAGKLVTREQLVKHLWPDLTVNFDRSLNTAVNVLRNVLGDSRQTCRYIETRPGLGYRFIGSVEPRSTPRPGSQATTGRRPDRSPVRQDCLAAHHFCQKGTEDALRKGMAQYEAVLLQDASCAPAHAGLASALVTSTYLGMFHPSAGRAKAQGAAAKAVELDADLPESFVARARIDAAFDRDWAGAEALYSQALAQYPENELVGRHYAALLAQTGRHVEALEKIFAAQEADPMSVSIRADAAWILCLALRFDAAIEQCWKALALEPTFVPAQFVLALAYQQLGLFEESFAEFENACACSNAHPVMRAALAHAYGCGGRREEARIVLDEVRRASSVRYVPRFWVAVPLIGLGEHDAALEELEAAYSDGDVWLAWMAADPRLSPLAGEPRFTSLREKLSLSRC